MEGKKIKLSDEQTKALGLCVIKALNATLDVMRDAAEKTGDNLMLSYGASGVFQYQSMLFDQIRRRFGAVMTANAEVVTSKGTLNLKITADSVSETPADLDGGEEA